MMTSCSSVDRKKALSGAFFVCPQRVCVKKILTAKIEKTPAIV